MTSSLLKNQPDVSIIIVNWNTCELLRKCIQSIEDNKQDWNIEIIVVDNASSDDSLRMLKEVFPNVITIRNQVNVGFAKANNQAFKISQGTYVLLLNSDAELTKGVLDELISCADEQTEAGIIGARLINPDGTFQASHTKFPSLMREFLILSGIGRLLFGAWYPSEGPGNCMEPFEVDYVEGACMLVRSEALHDVGGMDENYFMYAEEVDWCLMMKKAGWQIWYVPTAKVIHHSSASSRSRPKERELDLYRSRVKYFNKHYGKYAALSLAIMILITAIPKILLHKLLRFITHGQQGRPTLGFQELLMGLQDV